MTKRQRLEALRKWNRREQAKKAERLVLSDYPGSHNPYLPHEPGIYSDCFPGCVRSVSFRPIRSEDF